MRYCLGIDTEERDRCKKIIDEFNNDIGNWDPDWVNDEVKEEYEMWNECVEMALRRLKRAEYFLEYVNARSLNIPVDVNLPIVKSKITKKLFLDLTVFLEECGYKEDNEKNFNIRRFIYISKHTEKGPTAYSTGISSQYVYDVLDNPKKEFLVNKHLIVPMHACCYVISSVISTVNLRNSKFLEIITLWCKEYNSILKNTNTGFEFLKELFKDEDIPIYQKNELGEFEEVENGMQLWLEEKEKLPSIKEYFSNREEIEERIRKASENERNELFNDKSEE